MPMIPAGIIEDIKARNDIEDVISGYVTLKRAGSNLVGSCPFHSERTPSFTVFSGTQNFYCFGCGAGGDVISFIMRAENLDYRAALELLANRAGITIPLEPAQAEHTVKRARVLAMNKEAARFFRDKLFSSEEGAEARAYLTGRGLSQATIKRFGLGYSPASFGALRDYLSSLGYTTEEMTAGFLCGVSKKNGRAFDYFRNRVMFPIIDVTGNIVAFGGRVMDSSEPKYLNSSDTPAFKKSKNLFALNFARNQCAEEMILCEGYMDVIALHAAGFGNAVATLGTALTSEQARIMAKYTKKVIISYDSDAAGVRAAQKAMRIFGEVGLDVRVLKLSGAKDPDEYIQKFGPDKFRQVLAESRTRFEYRLEDVLSRHDLSVIDEKVKASAELVDIIAAVPGNVEREVYIQRVSAILEVPKSSLQNDVERAMRRTRKNEQKKISTEAYRQTAGFADRINPDTVKNLRASRLEEAVLGLLLLYPEYMQSVEEGRVALRDEDFFTDFGREVYARMCEVYAQAQTLDIGVLGQYFSPEQISRITHMKTERMKLTKNNPAVFTTAVSDLVAESARARARQDNDVLSIIEAKRRKANS